MILLQNICNCILSSFESLGTADIHDYEESLLQKCTHDEPIELGMTQQCYEPPFVVNELI